MKLTTKAKEKLASGKIKTLIAVKLDRSLATIQKWVREEDEKLTMIKVIEAIAEFTELDESEIFEPTEN